MSVDNTLDKVLTLTATVSSFARYAAGIVKAVRDGKVRVHDASGRELSADEVQAHWDVAEAAGNAAGDQAEARIERRHDTGA
jgi:hypothetical protein